MHENFITVYAQYYSVKNYNEGIMFASIKINYDEDWRNLNLWLYGILKKI